MSSSSMSDSLLKQLLLDHGEKVGPITDTTRKLYINKLKKLNIKSQSKQNLRSKKLPSDTLFFHSNILDVDTTSTNKKGGSHFPKTLRSSTPKTVACSATSHQTSNDKKNNFLTSHTDKQDTNLSINKSSLSDGCNSNDFKLTSNCYHCSTCESDSDPESNSIFNFSKVKKSSLLSKINSNKSRLKKGVFCSDESISHNPCNDQPKLSNPLFPSGYLSQLSSENIKLFDNSVKNGYFSSDSEDENPRSTSHHLVSSNSFGKKKNTSNLWWRSFLPNFFFKTKKLYSIKNIHFPSFRKDNLKSSFLSKFNCPIEISHILLTIFTLFFLVLAFIYLHSVEYSTSTSVDEKSFNMCKGKEFDDEQCYQMKNQNKIEQILDSLLYYLMKVAGDFDCGKERTLRHVSIEKLSHHFQDQNFTAYLDTILQLILHNPQWKINLLDKDGSITKSIPEVFALEAITGSMPFWCRVQISTARLFYFFCWGLIGICILLILLLYVYYHWTTKKKELQEVYNLVEKIIDLLKSHYERCQRKKCEDLQPYLAIVHIRDQLIPLSQRKTLQNRWESAVKFLSANESRIRVETQKISGEDFAVWRWLHPIPAGNKVWHGQAFGENLGTPSYSPTQCLKIRNMFDIENEYEEDWHIYIQDAVLDKVGQNHGIQHIAVDKSSKEGCVYVKCSDASKAGNAFKNIHGWYFDGELVTVKYLRLERYYERFPDARKFLSDLQPSNNKRSSLGQPFHKSIIESS